ncbi:hypothetical protein YC2023_058160 [Brassica napus]
MNKGSSFKLDNDYGLKAEADRIREKYPDRIPVCSVSCKGFIFMLYALFLDSTYKNMIFGENPRPFSGMVGFLCLFNNVK